MLWRLGVAGVLAAGARAAAVGPRSRGCPTPTTPTRTRTSCRARSGCSATTWTRATTSIRSAYTYVLHILLGRPLRRAPGGGGGVRERPDARCGRWPARRARCLARWPSACSTSPAGGSPDARQGCSPPHCSPWRSCRSSTATWRSTTSPRSRRCASRCGARRGSCGRAAGCDYLIAGIGIGLAAATKYTGGIVLLALLAAFGAHATRNRGAALRGLLLAGVMALVGVLRRVPVRDHRPPRVPRRAEPPVRRLRARRRASSASRRTTAGSTTSGRSAGGWAGRRSSRPPSRSRCWPSGATGRSWRSWSRRRSSTSPSWARRSASSGAGSCRCCRSSACSPRSAP